MGTAFIIERVSWRIGCVSTPSPEDDQQGKNAAERGGEGGEVDLGLGARLNLEALLELERWHTTTMRGRSRTC
jgi:hypothetical protein